MTINEAPSTGMRAGAFRPERKTPSEACLLGKAWQDQEFGVEARLRLLCFRR